MKDLMSLLCKNNIGPLETAGQQLRDDDLTSRCRVVIGQKFPVHHCALDLLELVLESMDFLRGELET